MLVYQRYIIRNIILPLIVATFLVTSIVWLTQLFKFLHLIDKGIDIGIFFHITTLLLPSLLFIVLPFVTAITIVYIYNKLSQERELIILRNSGLSNYAIANPALLLSVFVTIFAFYLSVELLPASHKRLKKDLHYVKNNYISKLIAEKTFNKLSKYITCFVNQKSSNNKLNGIILFDNRNVTRPAIIFAKTGTINPYKETLMIELSNGSRQIYDKNGNITILNFDSLIIDLDKEDKRDSDSTTFRRNTNEYYIRELLNPHSSFNSNQKAKLIAEGYQRLIWPLYNFILPFIALAILLRQPYSKEPSNKSIFLIAAAIAITIFIHFSILNIAAKNLEIVYYFYIHIVIIISLGIWTYKHK